MRCRPGERGGCGYPKRLSQDRSVLALTFSSAAASLVLSVLTGMSVRQRRPRAGDRRTSILCSPDDASQRADRDAPRGARHRRLTRSQPRSLSFLSAVTRSCLPLPQRTVSRRLSRLSIVSLPPPPSSWSMPLPPASLSLPPPPRRRSLPPPPERQSSPLPPARRSSPPRPLRRSPAAVPTRRSLPALPRWRLTHAPG